MARGTSLLSLILFFCVSVLALDRHHRQHGGHLREYVLCAKHTGELYFYKNTKHSNISCEVDLAKARVVNSINQTGWGLVDVEVANEEVPEYLQGYAAGFLEARATRSLIAMHIKNTAEGYCKGAKDYCERLALFLLQNLAFMREQIVKNPDDLYWRHVNITINQMAGMIQGFEGELEGRLSDNDLVIHPLYLIQIPWEVKDLEKKLGKPKNLRKPWAANGHCSALVKPTDDNKDLLFSHITWDSYSSMLRMQKRYRFKLPMSPGSTYTFSGYPGVISSVDDFVLSSAQLAILETTIENYNKDILQFITPSTVLCWLRTQLATRLASTAAEWIHIFGRYNSGTYNNQWVVVDYKKFNPGMSSLAIKGLMHISEQLPGSYQEADMSEHLEKHRFWPSYNMPFFPKIYELSETRAFADKYGDFFTYNRTPRALIFKRDQHTVFDVDSMRRMMRYNNYTTDPLSRCDCTPPYSAACTIASRSDLNPQDGKFPFDDLIFKDMGATDVKITNVAMMRTLSFDAVAGPTYDPLPIFSWKTTPLRDNVSHVGQPDQFRFPPLRHIWSQRSLYTRNTS